MTPEKPKGNDDMLREMGLMDEVDDRFITEEERLQLEQERVEAEPPATDEPGEEGEERPPAEEDNRK